ncbi:MAG: hypothetical protein RBR52_14490 [Thiomonas sp.]|uniref:hypothetical protein n=1 Tax=Thiomonas sp. TaxID=2047785 RepID=UPI002A35BD81|nr:hypothetical protein [Thiomonas sp.]MDY0331683.1 hypothetical protein [Thiomonas sp.]
MTIDKAIALGIAGNAFSKKLTGTSEVSAARTAVATGSGAALGATAAGTITVGIFAAEASGLVAAGTAAAAAAPIAVPLCAAAAIFAGIASLFD